MKLLSYVAICAILLLNISSCQKTDSQNSTDQKTTSDTLLTRIHAVLQGTVFPTRDYYYDFTYDGKGRLSKYTISWGDTLTNFTYDDRGYLTGFTDSTTQDPDGYYVGQFDIYTIQYNGPKIIITDSWRTPSQRGVKTIECTLKDSLIVEKITNRENYTDTVKYTWDNSGNITKTESSASRSVSTPTFDKNYRNPYLIKGNPIFNLICIGGITRNAIVASASTQTDAMGNVTTSSSKTDILEHLGTYPTRTQLTSLNVKYDYTFTYSVQNN